MDEDHLQFTEKHKEGGIRSIVDRRSFYSIGKRNMSLLSGSTYCQDEIVSVMASGSPLQERNLEEVHSRYLLMDRKITCLSAHR